MGKLTDFVRERKLKMLRGEERRKFVHEENERRMKEIRERVREKAQNEEWERIKEEVFADSSPELPTGTITCTLADDILNE